VRWIVFLLFITTQLVAQQTALPIGTWQEHLPYNSAIDLTASADKIFAATPYSVFSVNRNTKELQRFSKVTGLSETGVTAIHFDNQQLWIAYFNSNIDAVTVKGIRNISDLKRATVPGDKTIYHFFSDDAFCYASTGFGVLQINKDKYEIKDTWIIGQGGGRVKTWMVTKDQSNFYAATDEGLKSTPVNNSNPSDHRTWQLLSGRNGLQLTACKGVVNLGGQIIALQNDSLFVRNGTDWRLLFANGLPITSIKSSEEAVAITQRMNTNSGQVIVLNKEGIQLRQVQHHIATSTPSKALHIGNETWVADAKYGLSKFTSSGQEHFLPNSPAGVPGGEMLFYDQTFYATGGGVSSAWSPLLNPTGIFRYQEGSWHNFNATTYPQLSGITDFVSLAIDPRNGAIWAGTFGSGLVHISTNNQFQNIRTAPIAPSLNDPNLYAVTGLAFDDNNHLWVANFGANPFLHVLKNNNTWQSFTAPFAIAGNAVTKILIDDADQKWMISPLGNGLLCFNHGSSIENVNDDRWKKLGAGSGNGNLPSNEVLSLLKDKNGYIWVGTADGIGIIECPQEVFRVGCEATLPVVQQSSFGGYLFKGEKVQAMALDGANRKWIGTSNGVWLINEDGSKTIDRFTESNSPLPSNDIRSIIVAPQTGEVFIATTKGLVTYKGTATEGTPSFENVRIYPNPVTPSYGGSIAITGLKESSYCKITELNGKLVYQSRALGGQVIWNGKNARGHNISSGVYLVLITDASKEERVAGKIVFIAK
jgi:hypothetical protein